MKTIRHNTFETNSSSTHSLTVVTNTDPSSKLEDSELVIDNILYPAKLRDIAISEAEDGSYGSSTHRLVANNVHRKAALLIHQLWNFFDDSFHEEWCESHRRRIIEAIRRKCLYVDIVLPDNFYPYYDIGSRYSSDFEAPSDFPMFDFLGRTLNDKPIIDMNGLHAYIHTHIIDSSITIIDTNESY